MNYFQAIPKKSRSFHNMFSVKEIFFPLVNLKIFPWMIIQIKKNVLAYIKTAYFSLYNLKTFSQWKVLAVDDIVNERNVSTSPSSFNIYFFKY